MIPQPNFAEQSVRRSSLLLVGRNQDDLERSIYSGDELEASLTPRLPAIVVEQSFAHMLINKNLLTFTSDTAVAAEHLIWVVAVTRVNATGIAQQS